MPSVGTEQVELVTLLNVLVSLLGSSAWVMCFYPSTSGSVAIGVVGGEVLHFVIVQVYGIYGMILLQGCAIHYLFTDRLHWGELQTLVVCYQYLFFRIWMFNVSEW